MRTEKHTSVNTSGILVALVMAWALAGCQGFAPTESQMHDTVHSKSSSGFNGAHMDDPFTFDQTGDPLGCAVPEPQNNETGYADKFMFPQNTAVTEITIFTCDTAPTDMIQLHIQIFDNNTSNEPGDRKWDNVVDVAPGAWTEDINIPGLPQTYKAEVSISPPDPFDANTIYWVSVSGVGFPFHQFTVTTDQPLGDGEMAALDGDSFDHFKVSGDMKFILEGEPSTPSPITVDIDIRPYSDRNCINLDSDRYVPVAIFGSADFNVRDIDRSSLELEGNQAKQRWSGKIGILYDVNLDGFVELLVRFPIEGLDLTEADTEGILTGMLQDGTPFEGRDSICIVDGYDGYWTSSRKRR